jgi:hypothetical protein
VARLVPRRALLLLFCLTLGAACDRTRKVTPWLEYERRRPVIDIPHVLTSRPYTEIVRVRLGGQWREVLRSEGLSGFHELDPTALDDGRAVLVRRTGSSLIFREGVELPAWLDSSVCPWPEVTLDRRLLACFFLEDASGDWRHAGRRLVRARTELRDARADVLDSAIVRIPEALSETLRPGESFIGWTAQGTAVLEVRLFAEGAKSTCVALALEPTGARELARVGPQSSCPSAADWAERIPGLARPAP